MYKSHIFHLKKLRSIRKILIFFCINHFLFSSNIYIYIYCLLVGDTITIYTYLFIISWTRRLDWIPSGFSHLRWYCRLLVPWRIYTSVSNYGHSFGIIFICFFDPFIIPFWSEKIAEYSFFLLINVIITMISILLIPWLIYYNTYIYACVYIQSYVYIIHIYAYTYI